MATFRKAPYFKGSHPVKFLCLGVHMTTKCTAFNFKKDRVEATGSKRQYHYALLDGTRAIKGVSEWAEDGGGGTPTVGAILFDPLLIL